MHRSDNS